MKSVLVIVSALATLSATQAQIAPINSQSLLSALSLPRTRDQPDQCKKFECPRFKVECNATSDIDDDYYVRVSNETSLWAVTDIALDNVTVCSGSPAFWNLFQYIDGQNDQNIKIDMSAPVLMFNPLPQNPTAENRAQKPAVRRCIMAFYIGRKHWSNPPLPTNADKVKLTWLPPHREFVRVLGGRPDDAMISQQAASLHATLKKNKERVAIAAHGFTFLRAQYDAPDVQKGRRNEVIFTEYPVDRLLAVNERVPKKSWVKPFAPKCGKA